jgi:hypothetical protein
MANLPYEYDFPGNQENTASIGFYPCLIARGRDNDIPGWDRKPPCLL